MPVKVSELAYSERFRKDMASADEPTRAAVKAALLLLMENASSRALRLHPLKGHKKPTIWKVDVYSNHSWQITFELNDEVAELKRLGTHREIDRKPR